MGGGPPRRFSGRGGRGGRGGYGKFKSRSGSWRGRGKSKGKGRDGGEDDAKLKAEMRAEQEKRQRDRLDEDIRHDAKFGYEIMTEEGAEKTGWLLNICSSSIGDKETGRIVSGVNLYFICQDGSNFKAQIPYRPYFYIGVKDDAHRDVEFYLRRRYESLIADVELVSKEDLDLKNHLAGILNQYLKISFETVQHLMEVRREVLPLIERNKAKASGAGQAYKQLAHLEDEERAERRGQAQKLYDYAEYLVDIREYDVPYHSRFAIDSNIRCGKWYTVSRQQGNTHIKARPDLVRFAETRVCAFDIEATKLPLQFPNAEFDKVFMLSYMLDKQGYLIINRDIVSEDVADFEYTPKPEFEGPFIVWNEKDEAGLLRRWFEHMREVRPSLYVTYNGDKFDFPFIEKRAEANGMSMYEEIGMRCDENTGECRSRFMSHMDAFCWVSRDSYLPQGSRGLKAVTKAKLRYDPIEIHPEDMVRLAGENPQEMASYSVSDAVATYYLYMTYVHPFIFSLATIIPLSPDEVLRKGSGTLCESLLMVQAYEGNIVCPNKHADAPFKIYNGQVLESESYIGGHVEALEAGIYRADIPQQFRLDPSGYERLIANLDRDLKYAIEVGMSTPLDEVTNYDEIKAEVLAKLEDLRDKPVRTEKPKIYHLDVAAMYPNIILTNRLQPSAMVTEEDCLACDFNRPEKTCLRKMEWKWRGEPYMATRAEFNHTKMQIAAEPTRDEDGNPCTFDDLSRAEQNSRIKKRFSEYCQKAYKKVMRPPHVQLKEASICMRENDFYVGTVLAFRDRRYEYKGLVKQWKKKAAAAGESGDQVALVEANDLCILYDSLQLAHKCILNSFYGYVMRKGARWYSMEMAGVVTHTGAEIIKGARLLVEKIGVPLELDTDGIWCTLPDSFPENYKVKTISGGSKALSYPCVMLNADVAENFFNDQYQTLVNRDTLTYETSKQMSIEFEVDGPYKAMILPASKDEGVLIKKRYAVFNFDGSLAELKGFEIKRRGELGLIKVFQAEVFSCFLDGETLEEAYASVAAVGNRWLDMLDTRGVDLVDDELINLIAEESNMSKSLDEYGERKSSAITTAKRLAEFLGDPRLKEKGLNCRYVVSRTPVGAKVTERTIPTAIFSTDPQVMKTYLRKWCKNNDLGSGEEKVDVRELLDWDYYKGRLGGAIQKIITIPAALQKVKNPVPRVVHPDWLAKRVRENDDSFKQKKLTDLYALKDLDEPVKEMRDVEDWGTQSRRESAGAVARVRRFGSHNATDGDDDAVEIINVHEDGDATQLRRPTDESLINTRPPKVPRRDEDFNGWLSHYKNKWRAERAKRKLEAKRNKNRRRFGDDATNNKHGAALRPGQTVENYFRQQTTAAVQSYWQILQVMPSVGRLGEYTAWVLVDETMYAVPLRLPKTVYVSLKPGSNISDSLQGSKAVRRILPHMRGGTSVLETHVPEEYLRDGGSRFASEIGMLSETDSVYETSVPCELSAVLKMGCVCVVARSVRERPMGQGYRLDELEIKNPIEFPYLRDGSAMVPHIMLYHALTSDTRGIWALALPSTTRGLMVVVSQSNARPVTSIGLDRHQRQLVQASTQLDESGAVQTPLTALMWDVDYVADAFEAQRRIQREIVSFRTEHRGPLLAVTQGSTSSSELALTSIPALSEMPCLELPHTLTDNSMPTLGWQNGAATVALERCASAEQWIEERIALARYAHVPIGNLTSLDGKDSSLTVSDVFFARALKDKNHLLWWNEGASRGLQLMEGQHPDEQGRVQIENPGVYRCVSVELKIYNVLVNSIDKSSALNELEGGALLGLETDGANEDVSGTEESTRAVAAFKVLRGMVQNWLDDASQHENAHANQLLLNLHRWLSSSSTSSLYDPVLLLFVNTLAQKMFLLLLNEMKHLGAEIVSADFGHITLNTGKRDPSSAAAYTNYLITALKQSEFFSWLELTPERYWHTLVYMDAYNYGGVVVPNQELDVSIQQQGSFQDEEACIVSEFTTEQYLPPALQEHFRATISEFIYKPWHHVKENLRSIGGGTSQDAGGNLTQSIVAARAVERQESENKYMSNLVRSYFTDKLLRLTKDISIHIHPGSGNEDHEFPLLAGSHLSPEELGSPALAFARAVTSIMSLEDAIKEDVALMRKQLLRLLYTKEFSREAATVELCQSFMLRNVSCGKCHDCRDIDICRDRLLNAKGREGWVCGVASCGHPYDMLLIEDQLIGALQRYVGGYQSQDLRCEHCGAVKGGRLQGECGGSNRFYCTQTKAAMEKKLKLLHNVAVIHEMEVLRQLIESANPDLVVPEDEVE